jgi:hypothetical protein
MSNPAPGKNTGDGKVVGAAGGGNGSAQAGGNNGGAGPDKEIPDKDDQKPRLDALFGWAERVLEEAGLLQLLRDAKTREELDGTKFEPGNVKLIVAISDALHPGSGKKREPRFEHLSEKALEAILRNRFNDFKKELHKKLIADEQQTVAEEDARQKREEDVKFFGEFGQYKARDCGVFVQTEEQLLTGELLTKWVQISRTRIELTGVTRSNQDDNWGVYVKIVNMDGRVMRLAIPRNIINDVQGTIAGRLADLGVDVVREQRELLPDFLLSTVEIVDGHIEELARLMAVPTTGWYQLNNERSVFVLPHTTKIPADMSAGELAIFQNEQLHLQHGFAVAGTVEEWREQILEPFVGNSNVTLAVGAALSGPLTVHAGVPPGIFHIFCDAKFGKSLASAVGQSVYGRPLIPNETVADPFGMSWLATANHIGQIILTRSSLVAFFEESGQGEPKAIADAAYRIANGITKGRLRAGRGLEPRLTYCVPGFSTGEEAMIDFLTRNGQRVTLGMRTRFADIPAEVQSGSVFEKFSADEVPSLGSKYYPLLSTLYGAVGDVWLQHLVDMGPEQIRATVKQHQEEFRARPKVQALYKAAAPFQRSVIGRFATVAAGLRMGNDAGLLWKDAADTDADIEACVMRWAEHEKMDVVMAAIARFMLDRESWEGTASELKSGLDGAIDSADSLGRWIKKSENLTRLKSAGFIIVQQRQKTHVRARLIRIERVKESNA